MTELPLSSCKELQAVKSERLTEIPNPVIHSVFHNSVENQALENAAKVLFGATFRGKCCGNSCGSSGKNHRAC
jgi:hypothetical protein